MSVLVFRIDLLLLRSLNPFVHLKNCRKCHRLRLRCSEERVLSSFIVMHIECAQSFQICQCIFSTEHRTIVYRCEREMDENLAKLYFVI